jgi:cellulose synthase/poly-beta-1,6-N-acetylglucosamine synthase-like glycosyltransferase
MQNFEYKVTTRLVFVELVNSETFDVLSHRCPVSLISPSGFVYNCLSTERADILDKPTESIFGYITVLPGAFSAYRYIALQNDELGHGPLHSYFQGEELSGSKADVFQSNLYLAEDRILCWELVSKRGHSWILKYVKSASGETGECSFFASLLHFGC